MMFSGKYSYLRKDGDARILAEVEGAAAITSIHMPEPSDAPLWARLLTFTATAGLSSVRKLGELYLAEGGRSFI